MWLSIVGEGERERGKGQGGEDVVVYGKGQQERKGDNDWQVLHHTTRMHGAEYAVATVVRLSVWLLNCLFYSILFYSILFYSK